MSLPSTPSAAAAHLPAESAAASSGPAAAAPALQPHLQPTPGIWRRLAAFLYEGVLLFGVVTIAGLAYSVLTDQRHALQGSIGMQAVLFVVLALYFGWFWTRSGQTLAMQTWHIRVVTADGRPLSRLRALCRYLLSWLWFLPALSLLAIIGVTGAWPFIGTLCAGVLLYALLARLHPDRQFLHDRLCGTRLVSVPRRAGLRAPRAVR